jgi:delta1-piperideine-2-carboxylate reductase
MQLALSEIADLATAAFKANGCDDANTAAISRTIVAAERDGARSHGLIRVPGYVASLRSGKVNGGAQPSVAHTTPVVLSVDGDRGFAPLALERTVPLLAGAAKTFGVAVASVRRTHHFAALWPEVESLAAQNLIGVACVCYLPVMAPAGGSAPLFGTNPIAFGYPRPGHDPVIVDMATAAMAMGEVRLAAREGRQVPPGVGLTADGRPTLDPREIVGGMLLPFGGYKGSALALMVELLAAGAIGESFSFEAADGDNADGGPPIGGEFLLALSPEIMAGPGWAEHSEDFFKRYEAIQGARLPGTRRHRLRTAGEVRDVDPALVTTINALARR